MPDTTVRAATVRAESLKLMSPFTPTPSLADPQEFTDPDAPVAAAPTPAGAIHAAEGLCDVGARVLDESDTLVLEHAWPGPKTVNYYVILVSKGTTSHTVRRRYKDFDALNVALGDTYGKHMVPPNFPGKQLVKNESAEFVEQRRHELRRWLAAVTEDRYLSLSPEVCAFLECEAATQLAARTAALSASAALLAAELGAAEHQAARAEEHAASLLLALQRAQEEAAAAHRRADAADAAAAAARGATLRALLAKRADRQVADAFRRLRRGAAPPPTPAADAAAAAPDAVAAGEAPAVCGKPRDDAKTPATVAPPAAKARASGVSPTSITELGDLDAAALDTPVRGAGGAAAAAAVDGGAAAHAAAQAAAGGERVVKAGSLLKQGSLNNEFRERFCELVSLGDGGRSFLVYYEAAAPPASSSSPYEPYEAEAPKGAVKGYICLDGASAATLDHPTQQHCLLITLPARRLSFLTPGVSPGPLFTPTLRSPVLPSADDQMSLLQKLDAWGKGVVRNALASGPLHAPQTTWTLAARSAADALEWQRAINALSAAPPSSAPLYGLPPLKM